MKRSDDCVADGIVLMQMASDILQLPWCKHSAACGCILLYCRLGTKRAELGCVS
jgi:hypothetical protein